MAIEAEELNLFTSDPTHIALAHGREDPNTPHPKLIARRRVARAAR